MEEIGVNSDEPSPPESSVQPDSSEVTAETNPPTTPPKRKRYCDGLEILSPQPCPSDPNTPDCQSPNRSISEEPVDPHPLVRLLEQQLLAQHRSRRADTSDYDSDASTELTDVLDDDYQATEFNVDSDSLDSSSSRYPSTKPLTARQRALASAKASNSKIPKMASGVLVWTLLPSNYNLPWWPAIIVGSKPDVHKSPGGKDALQYRVMLILPPGHIDEYSTFFVPRSCIQILRTREAFENFMETSLEGVLENRDILAQFIVPLKLESLWAAARELIFEMEEETERSLAARLKFLDLDLKQLRRVWSSEDERLSESRRAKSVKSRSSDGQYTALMRQKPETIPRLDNAFRSLLHVFKGSAAAKNICCVCLKPGRLLQKSGKYRKDDCGADAETESEVHDDDMDELEEHQHHHKATSARGISSTLCMASNHVKKASKAQKEFAQRLAEAEALEMASWPVLVPCAEACPNYIHLECAEPGDRLEVGQEGPKIVCRLCKEGLRQCCVCLEVQPIAGERNGGGRRRTNGNSAAAGGAGHEPLRRCMVPTCQRWFHREGCLRQGGAEPNPEGYLAELTRGGVGETFACPAHTCTSCWAASPGVPPHTTPQMIHCLFCPTAFHSDEWCIPAGSIWLTRYWIICPRHAVQSPPESLLKPSPSQLKLKNTPEKGAQEEATPQLPSLYSQLALSRILPPEELRSHLASWFRPTNTSWCLICSDVGKIVCCETCPASFHLECLRVDELEEQFFCEDCTNGRVPRYGEIVWVRLPSTTSEAASRLLSSLPPSLGFLRHAFPPADTLCDLGSSRWWPAEVLHPRTLLHSPRPQLDDYSTPQEPGKLGFFAVRLFGVYSATPFNGIPPEELLSVKETPGDKVFPVCLWTTQARVFYFEEDDAEHEEENNHREHVDASDGEGGGDDDSVAEEDPVFSSFLASPSRNASHLSSPSAAAVVPRRSLDTSLNTSHRSRRQQRTSGVSSANRDAYLLATRLAGEAFTARKEARDSHLKSVEDRPEFYEFIKTNRPIGSVRIRRLDNQTAQFCDCRGPEPCGPESNCINRHLLYECHAGVCRHGKLCRNQFFSRREYPKQVFFYTGPQRGWGLKTAEPIKKDAFVNEYVGDLIDEAEANRRLEAAHRHNIRNFYMMKMDHRIIDAGPKGNLSRFMNHSCAPNLYTQKWTVNGDTRVGLFALRDIEPGEELTFDYNFSSLGQEMQACLCGAETCAGFVGARPEHNAPETEAEAEEEGEEGEGTTTASSSVAAKSLRSRPARPTKRKQKTKAPLTRGSSSRKSKTAPNQQSSGPETSTVSGTSVGSSSAASSSSESFSESEGEETDSSSGTKVMNHKKAHPAGVVNGSTSTSVSLKPTSKCLTCGQRISNFVKIEVTASPNSSVNTSGEVSSVQSKPLRQERTSKKLAKSGVVCPQQDCRKAYHIACLGLQKAPSGRWVCPRHHCDVCGRPSRVFCEHCTRSFCTDHVEGSVTVIPFPNALGFPQVLCLSHTELIEHYKNEVEDTFDSEDSNDESDGDDDVGSETSDVTTMSTDESGGQNDAPRVNGDVATRKRRSKADLLKLMAAKKRPRLSAPSPSSSRTLKAAKK